MNFGNHNQETSSMGPYRPTGESARTTRSTVKRTGETLTEPLGHKPKVKIGSKFQANLPEWPDIYGDENEAIEEECIIPPFSTFSEIHQLDTFSARQKRCLSRIFNNDDDWLGASKGQFPNIKSKTLVQLYCNEDRLKKNDEARKRRENEASAERAARREAARIERLWTAEEGRIFLNMFTINGPNFVVIAESLPEKSAEEVEKFY